MSVFWIALLACAPAPLSVQDESGLRLEYEVSIPKPTTHLIHVDLTIRGAPGKTLDLVMPVWTPGSYKVRDYAKFVQDFAAGGLPFEKVDKTTWRIRHDGAETVRVRYRVFGHTVSVRHNHVDSEHATIIGAATFFYVRGAKHAPVRLEVRPPKKNWSIATGLKRLDPGVFVAPDYDVLIDSPIELGTLTRAKFVVGNTLHQVVASGPLPIEIERIRADLKKIVETTVAIYQDIPYERYVFLIRSWPHGAGGGLEHLNSTLMDVSTRRLVDEDGYRGFLGLATHEFFHTWLVKRIRPKALGPFDYTEENYTKLLWVMEGFTSYYTPVILRRAGLIDEEKALDSFARTLEKMSRRPGRKREGPAMASFNAWIHAYQGGPHSVNTTASYYSSGKVRGLYLDLEIRRRSKSSLDDVLRKLYREYYKEKGRGFTPEEFQAACEAVAGGSLEGFFEKTVRGTEDPDVSEGFEHVGLRLKKEEDGDPEPYLGVRLDGNRFDAVLENGPAWKAGVCVGDELLAVDGFKADEDTWQDYAKGKKRVRLTVFRRDILKEIEIELEFRPKVDFKLERLEKPSDRQNAAFRAWLGRD